MDSSSQIPSKQAILDLRTTASYEAKLIHLLFGTSDFNHDDTGEVIVQKINFAKLGNTTTSTRRKTIKKCLEEQSISICSIDIYLIKSIRQNEYFKELFDEFARFFIYSKKIGILKLFCIYIEL